MSSGATFRYRKSLIGERYRVTCSRCRQTFRLDRFPAFCPCCGAWRRRGVKVRPPREDT